MTEIVERVLFTTAPVDYDYDYVETLETFDFALYGSREKTWRKLVLRTSEFCINYQSQRYGSGLHPVYEKDPRDLQREFEAQTAVRLESSR